MGPDDTRPLRSVVIDVLPFEAPGARQAFEHSGSAIAEAVARAIGRLAWVQVRLDPTGDLSADFELSGLVRTSGDRVRVSARLASTDTGVERWSWSSTLADQDPFEVEDRCASEIATGIANLLGILTDGDFHDDPETFAIFQSGMDAYARFRRDGNASAAAHFERVIERRPTSALGFAFLAYAYATNVHFGWSTDPTAELQRAKDLAGRSAELNPREPSAHGALGYALTLERRYDEGAAAARRGVEVSGPTDSAAHHMLAINALYDGRFAETVALERQVLGGNPMMPLWDNARSILAQAAVHLGRNEEAVQVADDALVRNPTWISTRVPRSVALARLGRHDEAVEEARRILAFHPRFSTGWWTSVNPYRDSAHGAEITEVLHGLGLPQSPGEASVQASDFLRDRGQGRWLASILLTDIVGSTALAAQLGDGPWRDKLAAHDRSAKTVIEAADGRVVKFTGDGVLAVFERPSRALEAAVELRRELDELGLEIRLGVHTGEIEISPDDIHGIGVHIAARVNAAAGPGQVLTTSTVRSLVSGGTFTFTSVGKHELRGVPDTWELFAVGDA